MLIHIFYCFGLFMLARNIYDFIAKTYNKDIPPGHANFSDLDSQIELQKQRVAAVKKLGIFRTSLSIMAVGWPIIGLWLPEFGLFLTMVILYVIALMLTILAKTPDARKGVVIVAGIADITLISAILYQHYSYLLV